MSLPIEKTLLGVVPNLDSVLSGFEYLPKGDSRLSNKYFISSKFEGIKSFSSQYRNALYADLNPELVDKIQANCCEGKIGAFRLIPWKSEGVALLLADDKLMIASPWICFIPLDSLPTIESK